MGKESSRISLHGEMNNQKLRSRTNIPVGIQKKKRKNRNKTMNEKKIQMLFARLRSETSSSSADVTESNTVIILEDTNTSDQLPQRRESTIIITDDDDLITNNQSCVHSPRSSINQCPIQCSTPIHSQKPPDFSAELENITREINNDSYVTIDLTNNSTNIKHEPVIDLVDTADDLDCSTSMSGDSQVTVINTKKKNTLRGAQMKLANGIAEMNSSDRGKLLEFITEKIFSGCNTPHIFSSLQSVRNEVNNAAKTDKDIYIREVILGQAPSRNSIGSNIYNPQRDLKNKTGLRLIVVDGSNVAMQHTKGRVFSVEGLKICIDYFVRRGHAVKAFVPQFRCKYGKSTNGRLLDQLERQGLVVYTPSREIRGRMITPYDDRYIVQCAAEFEGVIVSGDNYRDLLIENPRWRQVIENRLLQFTWVGDMIMFPKDPLGRDGPTLEQFLRHPVQNN
ncbi:probable ribonuclease ZC3H12C isoform X1 [Leptidea sinapis]|uniref:probable ribonuclease ZC3H12C isoform X1 n=2 Tax=Leptidea sinapis TaxID=189913 RepID=UPI002139C6AE|nr:probable ribonuclease ZC3H12C isoform X1 [Leptidea sinapis]